MGVKMIATARHIYNGKQLRPGDPFECKDESEAKDYEALVMGQRAKEHVQAEQYTTDHRRFGRNRNRNTYHRRDLQSSEVITKSDEPSDPTGE